MNTGTAPDAVRRHRLKRWVSADAISLVNSMLRRGVVYRGNYATWEDAASHAAGYDSQAILERVVAATTAVRDGKAMAERDGIVLAKLDFPFPLIAALMRSAALNGGNLSVLDFGGGLGSTYYQCHPWIKGLKSCRWSVVEQGHFVQAGRENFEDGSLCFRNTIADAVDGMRPNVALLSGVLQYIPNAAGILAELVSTGIETIVIDRTPFVDDDATIISVQHVPSRIVKSSYPTYLFSQSNLLGDAWQNYRILVEFEAIDRTIFSLGRRIVFKGMILVKR